MNVNERLRLELQCEANPRGEYTLQVLSAREWLMCSRSPLKDGNSGLKIPTRTFFLPLNNPDFPGPLSLMYPSFREAQGWVFRPRICTLCLLSPLRTKNNTNGAACCYFHLLRLLWRAPGPGHQNALLEPTQLRRHLSRHEW